jgi:hypothetical protein
MVRELLNKFDSGQAGPELISLRRFRAELGVVPSTLWRWIQRGWLDRPIDIGGRKYLTAEMVRRFKERAARGEFAGKTKPPCLKSPSENTSLADPQSTLTSERGGGGGRHADRIDVRPMDCFGKILNKKDH